jgi:hypothetical protein
VASDGSWSPATRRAIAGCRIPSWRANADCDGPCSVRYLITRTASAVRFIFGLDFRVTQVLGVYLLGAVQLRQRRHRYPP